MKTLRHCLVFANSMVACFDDNGQVPPLQKSFVELFAENAVRNGYNPDGLLMETPSGNWIIRKTVDGGWTRHQT